MHSFDRDYFENGIATGKSCYENYHWMPIRSFKEAIAFIEYSDIDSQSKVIDIGCAKGFLVRAMRSLEINAEGCDISDYALSFCSSISWDAKRYGEWVSRKDYYTHAVLKDTLEHCTKSDLPGMIGRIRSIAHKFTCVVPIGINGRYIIDDYHKDPSHHIAESVEWWTEMFYKNGWCILKGCDHVPGLKDNYSFNIKGNHVFHMERF